MGQVKCPQCDAVYDVPPHSSGKTLKCVKCMTKFPAAQAGTVDNPLTIATEPEHDDTPFWIDFACGFLALVGIPVMGFVTGATTSVESVQLVLLWLLLIAVLRLTSSVRHQTKVIRKLRN